MAHSYGQYCPLALATELLAQRWTLLIVSSLLDGCDQFNVLQRALPRISPSLLSKRLTQLEDAGVVERHSQPGDRARRYRLTEAGQELQSVIMQLARWGHRWGRDMTTEDLDPAFLLWSMHLRMDREALPADLVVIEFVFTGVPSGLDQLWLVCKNGSVEMCLKDPGHETDLLVRSDIRVFVEAWRGFRDLRREIKSGRIRVDGPARLRREFPNWLLLSMIAPEQRCRPGRERRLRGRTN